ncbi:MAG TPA: ComEC/Rec2 family competence protein, partial [Aggregatilineales bacterium]|nr:ComEC/Rec2 family competence protein [Aggregatilineales bacterium]
MTLIYLALAWTAGIILASRANPTPTLILILTFFAFGAVIINRHDKTARLAFGVLLFFGLGMLRFDAARPDTDSAHVMQLNDSGQLTLQGVIVAAPEVRDAGLQIIIETEQAAGRDSHGRVLVRAPRYEDLAYGDEVRVFGFLRTPPEFDTFSYADYLARQKVFSVMYNADVEMIAHDRGSPFYTALLDIKAEARGFITRTLPEPQASLLVGILLGDESGISENVKAAFSRTGTSHVIAISGFNMVILAQIIMSILKRFLSDGKAAIAGLVAITVYTILVGAGGAVVRAAVMSGLLIVGQALHRKTYVPASIAFSVLLMSALDPWILWDVGFQLSLAAIVGMALFVNPLERLFATGLRKISSQENAQRFMGILSESLVVTLAAQITTTPLILYYFGRLSVVSLAVNFLIIPVQTPLLLLGAAG